MCCISELDLSRRFSPSKLICPCTMRAAGGRIRRIVRARVLLPEPDSPTMPSVSPACSVNDTSLTARTTRVPAALTKCVESSLISRSGGVVTGSGSSGRGTRARSPSDRSELPELGIELDAQPIAQEVRGEDHQHDAAP